MALPALMEEGLCSTALQVLTPQSQVDASPAWLCVSKEGDLCPSSGRNGLRSSLLHSLCSHVWGWGTQCQTHCHVEFLQKFSGEGCSAQPEVSPTPQPTWAIKVAPPGLSSVPTLFALCTFHLLLLCVVKILCVYLIFGCAGSLFSGYDPWVSHCGDFSCCGAWALGCEGVRNCGPWAQ